MRPGKEHNGLISGCRGKAQKSSIPMATNIREPQLPDGMDNFVESITRRGVDVEVQVV
jgi:hypothetical protein